MEFIQNNFNYVFVLLFTIISTSIYTLKTIYISKEKTLEVLITNALYVCANTMVTRFIVKGDTMFTVLVSTISSEIGYVCGFALKNKMDPSMQKEDKLWVFDVKCSDDLADRFMRVYGDKEGIKLIRVNDNQQEFVCSSKHKSKFVRNLIEVYGLEHTIQERFNFKHNKLTPEESVAIRNTLEAA